MVGSWRDSHDVLCPIRGFAFIALLLNARLGALPDAGQVWQRLAFLANLVT